MIKYRGPAPKYTTGEQVEKEIQGYFKECSETESYPTVSGLAYWLGISRNTLIKYKECVENGEALKHLDDSAKVDIVNSVKRAYEYIQNGYEDKLINGKTTPIGTIFALKNNFKWVDKQEIEQTNKTINVELEDD